MSQLTMLATQVHCVRDGQVLLMQRRKEPNAETTPISCYYLVIC